MTSKEIKALEATDLSERKWLKEIAFQLAVLNEAFAMPTTAPEVVVPSEIPPRRGPGRPRKLVN